MRIQKVWTDRILTTQENQGQIMVPLNPLTEYLDTVHSDGSNMRVLVGAPTKHIKSWQISKMQDGATPARGIKTLTLYQDEVKPTDLIDVANKEFYADYYSSDGLAAQDEVLGTLNAVINTINDTIKVGGSYKTLSVTVIDANGNDVTATYTPLLTPASWECYIDGVNMTSSLLVTWKPQTTNDTIKIKLEKDYTYIKKELVIKCNITPTLVGTITLSIT